MFERLAANGSRGQALPLIAFALVSFLGISALVADVGYWRYEQRMEQGAADSGAIAGANAMPYVTGTASPSPITTLAKMDTAANGFADGVQNVTVTVNSPPLTGPNAGSTTAVEVIVAKTQPEFFGGIFHHTQVVRARSVAQRGTAGRNCIYAKDSVTFNSSTINLPQCGIISGFGGGAGGYTANGGTITATVIGYRQGANFNNSAYYPKATPAPADGGNDPCPTVPGCAYIAAHPPTAMPTQTPAGTSGYNFTDGSSGLTMTPGYYPQGVNINAGNGAGTLTFAPGTYDFSSGLNINGGIPTIVGSEVTFYVPSGSLNINSSNMQLSAPTTGNYMGMLYYQPQSNQNSLSINSGPSGTLAGGLYLPGANLTVDGNILSMALIVANQIYFNSQSNINVPSSVFPGISTKPASLVE